MPPSPSVNSGSVPGNSGGEQAALKREPAQKDDSHGDHTDGLYSRLALKLHSSAIGLARRDQESATEVRRYADEDGLLRPGSESEDSDYPVGPNLSSGNVASTLSSDSSPQELASARSKERQDTYQEVQRHDMHESHSQNGPQRYVASLERPNSAQILAPSSINKYDQSPRRSAWTSIGIQSTECEAYPWEPECDGQKKKAQTYLSKLIRMNGRQNQSPEWKADGQGFLTQFRDELFSKKGQSHHLRAFPSVVQAGEGLIVKRGDDSAKLDYLPDRGVQSRNLLERSLQILLPAKATFEERAEIFSGDSSQNDNPADVIKGEDGESKIDDRVKGEGESHEAMMDNGESWDDGARCRGKEGCKEATGFNTRLIEGTAVRKIPTSAAIDAARRRQRRHRESPCDLPRQAWESKRSSEEHCSHDDRQKDHDYAGQELLSQPHQEPQHQLRQSSMGRLHQYIDLSGQQRSMSRIHIKWPISSRAAPTDPLQYLPNSADDSWSSQQDHQSLPQKANIRDGLQKRDTNTSNSAASQSKQHLKSGECDRRCKARHYTAILAPPAFIFSSMAVPCFLRWRMRARQRRSNTPQPPQNQRRRPWLERMRQWRRPPQPETPHQGPNQPGQQRPSLTRVSTPARVLPLGSAVELARMSSDRTISRQHSGPPRIASPAGNAPPFESFVERHLRQQNAEGSTSHSSQSQLMQAIIQHDQRRHTGFERHRYSERPSSPAAIEQVD